MVGSEILLGANAIAGEAVVLIDAVARRLSGWDVLKLVGQHSRLLRMLNQQLADRLSQARQSALCHALHTLEARLSTCLLDASHAFNSPTLPVSQEWWARVLGVQRTSLSMVAHTLVTQGLIRTVRGTVQILNRAALKKLACACSDEMPMAEEELTDA